MRMPRPPPRLRRGLLGAEAPAAPAPDPGRAGPPVAGIQEPLRDQARHARPATLQPCLPHVQDVEPRLEEHLRRDPDKDELHIKAVDIETGEARLLATVKTKSPDVKAHGGYVFDYAPDANCLVFQTSRASTCTCSTSTR